MQASRFTVSLAELAAGPGGVALAAIWGALWGSFFNVVIARIPVGESIVRPASHCRACRALVRWYDNLPVVSYLLLRGRCRHCGARYSVRYALVEALVALLTVGVYYVYVVQGGGDLGLRMAQFVIGSLFCGVLCAVAFIDLDTMRIPNTITYPGIPVAMALSVFMGHPHLWDGLVGGVGGYLLIRLIADGYELITKRQGMGYGDAKLLAMIGGLLGWQVLLPTMFLASLQGSIIGIGVLLIARQRQGSGAAAQQPAAGDTAQEVEAVRGDDEVAAPQDEGDCPGSLRHARIPFGPFLALAAIELLLLRHYLPTFFPYLYAIADPDGLSGLALVMPLALIRDSRTRGRHP